MRHPLTQVTREVRPLDLRPANSCLLLQDVHAPLTDAEEGWLAEQLRARKLAREFDEYFEQLDLVRPNITMILEEARRMDMPVVFSCFGYQPPAVPSPLQTAMGWLFDLSGEHGRFPAAWRPAGGGEIMDPRPGWGALSGSLAGFLARRQIENVIVMGSLLEYGVRQSCGELADRGLGCLVVSDGVTALTRDAHGFTAGNLAHGLTKFRTAAELMLLLAVLDSEGRVCI
ncbi:MAG: cysteine hydrolase family protein [Thermaerobacterales bacterium]